MKHGSPIRALIVVVKVAESSVEGRSNCTLTISTHRGVNVILGVSLYDEKDPRDGLRIFGGGGVCRRSSSPAPPAELVL